MFLKGLKFYNKSELQRDHLLKRNSKRNKNIE
jgi:hypothetical protein